MIVDILSNKKINQIVTELFIKKILKKWELQQTAFNHSSDIDFKDL